MHESLLLKLNVHNANQWLQRTDSADVSLDSRYLCPNRALYRVCYKDGSQLPPLNFTATCSTYGRYVIYYNERLDIVTYPQGYELFAVSTEICEFIVQGEVVKFDIIKHHQIFIFLCL